MSLLHLRKLQSILMNNEMANMLTYRLGQPLKLVLIPYTILSISSSLTTRVQYIWPGFQPTTTLVVPSAWWTKTAGTGSDYRLSWALSVGGCGQFHPECRISCFHGRIALWYHYNCPSGKEYIYIYVVVHGHTIIWKAYKSIMRESSSMSNGFECDQCSHHLFYEICVAEKLKDAVIRIKMMMEQEMVIALQKYEDSISLFIYIHSSHDIWNVVLHLFNKFFAS